MAHATEAIAARRPGRPSEGAREALIAAARELFTERDFDEVSTEELLSRAGVSRGAMYHHFETKKDLFRAAFIASETELLARLAPDADPEGSAFDFLLAGASAYMRASATEPELQRIGLRQSRRVLGWEGWREAAGDLGIGVLRGMVQAAADADELETDDAELTSALLLAAMIEAGLTISAAPDPQAMRAKVEPELLRLIEGLRAG
jgi:AcrR family transcriptional regulator